MDIASECQGGKGEKNGRINLFTCCCQVMLDVGLVCGHHDVNCAVVLLTAVAAAAVGGVEVT